MYQASRITASSWPTARTEVDEVNRIVTLSRLWSYASVGNVFTRPVNQMFFQPFVAYQIPHAVMLTVDSESTFDWEGPSGQTATRCR
jgi:hypothetical protein